MRRARKLTGADGRRAREPVTCGPSPEFAAKKLLAAGEQKIFEFARVVFATARRGDLHLPEFTHAGMVPRPMPAMTP